MCGVIYMCYLADLLLVQLLASCSFGGLAPRATAEKRQHYSKSNNPKYEQKAELHTLTHVAALADVTTDELYTTALLLTNL